MKRLCTLVFALLPFAAVAQQKEVLVVGVMHQLPEIVRTSYASLLRIAKDYQPQAIYVECVPPEDKKSWEVICEKAKGEMYDFWQIHNDLQAIGRSLPTKFDKNDYGRAVGHFQHKGDYANTIYYLYKIDGTPKRALGDEFYDLSLPLAAEMGIDSLRSFDCRIFDNDYYAAIKRAMAEWSDNGNGEAYAKLFRKDYSASMLPAMFGSYGRHSNSRKALQRAHDINAFGFAVTRTDAVQDVEHFWELRNQAMASNIGRQIEQNSALRSIVFVGSGHVVGICRVLRQKYPTLDVKMVDDL